MRTFEVQELVATIVPSGVRDDELVAECDPRGHLSKCPGTSQSFICQDDAADHEILGTQSKKYCDVPKTNRPSPKPPRPTTPPEGELELLRRQLRAVKRR